ncbi:MAG: hypothetical protein FWF02_15275 [Micrococcales bacterium]|nr:hypothetical protein [Micrococcales bacterium]MCL2669030.1 hypothetical protein [Micrococcales bacterium]
MTGAKARRGDTFGYDATVRQTGRYEAHPDLDPARLNRAGANIRESRDSDEHPESTPIIVGFDSTGSMGSVPRIVQAKLKTLFWLLLDKGYASDPQVAIATYGDATCDHVPLQFSQFESDNRIDENLDNLFLEGGGGGNDGETSQLLLYYAAYHTATDAWERRHKRGYLFLIADEKQVPISAKHVKAVIGDDEPLGDLSSPAVAKAVAERWAVRVLLITNGTALYQRSQEFYTHLFGAEAIVPVQDPTAIAETIAALIGYDEGRDLDTITDDLATAAGGKVATRVEQSLSTRARALAHPR